MKKKKNRFITSSKIATVADISGDHERLNEEFWFTHVATRAAEIDPPNWSNDWWISMKPI